MGSKHQQEAAKISISVAISVLWFALILGIIIAANTGNLGWAYRLAELIPLFDKFGHALLFGGMSFVTGLALPATNSILNYGVHTRLHLPQGSWFVLLFAVLEECSQLLLVHRNFDVIDLLVNVAAITAGGFVAKFYLQVAKKML